MNAELVPLAFTVPQVAAVLGVPLRDARNLVEDGVIRSIAIGVRRIVPRDELMRFLEAKLVRPSKWSPHPKDLAPPRA